MLRDYGHEPAPTMATSPHPEATPLAPALFLETVPACGCPQAAPKLTVSVDKSLDASVDAASIAALLKAQSPAAWSTRASAVTTSAATPKPARGYSDAKVANREIRVWHGATGTGP